MKVKGDKSQYVVFSRNKTISDEHRGVESDEIMLASCVKLLGE